MFWIRTLALTLVLAVTVSAEDKKPAEFDAKSLVGKWTFTEGVKGGEKTEADKLKDPAEITADKITLKTPDATFVFKYKADSKASPVAIDMEILEPDGFKGAKAKGIIALDGGVLKLAYNPAPDGARPKDFKSTKDNGNHVYTMKKAKKDDK
jgi:uncharacterized protein (TIGR03067 family)